MKTETRWLSVQDVSDYLGISIVTTYRLLLKKSIPCYRIGKLWRFSADDIDKWVRSGKSKNVSTKDWQKSIKKH